MFPNEYRNSLYRKKVVLVVEWFRIQDPFEKLNPFAVILALFLSQASSTFIFITIFSQIKIK